jgi:RNA polymerase sigma-70 factor (ECF subfamily)
MGKAEHREEVLKLFTENIPLLTGYAYTVLENWDLARDAVQEAALFVSSRWKDFKPGTNFLAWARTVVHLRCREVIRKKTRGKAVSLSVIGDSIPDESWEKHGQYSDEEKTALALCMDSLPEQYREITDLRYRQSKSCEEIAGLKERTTHAVYLVLSRARQRLRDCVQKRLAAKD